MVVKKKAVVKVGDKKASRTDYFEKLNKPKAKAKWHFTAGGGMKYAG